MAHPSRRSLVAFAGASFGSVALLPATVRAQVTEQAPPADLPINRLGTLADLRSQSPAARMAAGQLVYVTGAGKPGIGGGFFRLDGPAQDTTDNGGTVIVDSAGQLWRRVFDGIATPEMFGAMGDGEADDSAAFAAALKAAPVLECPGAGRIYRLRDIELSGMRIRANGALFLAAEGARFMFRLTGWASSIEQARLSDDPGAVIRNSKLGRALKAGDTSASVGSNHGFEPGMLFMAILDDGLPFATPINAVNGNSIQLERGLLGPVQSGQIVSATFGMVNVTNATSYRLQGLEFVAASACVYSCPLNDDDKPGTAQISDTIFNTYSHFAFAFAKSSREVTVHNTFARGGKVVKLEQPIGMTSRAIQLPIEVPMKRDLHLSIGGKVLVEGRDYTARVARGVTTVELAHPNIGASLSVSAYTHALFGRWHDAKGWSAIRGGHAYTGSNTFIQNRVGSFLAEQELMTNQGVDDDTSSHIGLWGLNLAREVEFANAYEGFAALPVRMDNCPYVQFTGDFVTWITPDTEWASRTSAKYAIEVNDGSVVEIQEGAWSVTSDRSWQENGSGRFRIGPAQRLGDDGTAAAPTFAFAHDPDTGIYRPGENNICVAIGGQPAALVAPDGAYFNGALHTGSPDKGQARLSIYPAEDGMRMEATDPQQAAQKKPLLIQSAGGKIILGGAGTQIILDLPDRPNGLPKGAIWNDDGTIRIA